MFVRNGQALGSVHHATAPKAERPKKTAEQPKKRGRPPKVEDPQPDTAEKKPTGFSHANSGQVTAPKKEAPDDGDDQDR